MKSALFLMLAVSLIAFPAYSDDPGTQDALNKTRHLLTNSQAREEAVRKDQRAYDADLKARSLMGNAEDTDALYGLSADIFEKIVQKTNGDVGKLNQMLLEAQSNPKKFYESLGIDQKQQIKELGERIERRPTSNSR